MKLQYFILFVLLFAFIGCNSVEDNGLEGSWGIVEFRMFQGENEVMTSTKKNLTDAGSVWNLTFSKNGKFRQDFNMRNPQMKIETENGTWNISNDSLKILLFSDTLTTKMNYIYKINNRIGNSRNRIIKNCSAKQRRNSY